MSDRYSLMKAYDKLRLMRDKDVLSLVANTNGWKITDKLVMNRAMFVAPDGSIVVSTSNKGTHEQLFNELLSIVSGINYDNTDDPFYFDTAIYNLLRDYTSLKEWIRLNGGSNAVEQRCYAVLTNWNEGRPSNSQFNVFEDFVNMAYDNKKDYVIVFFGGDGRDVKMFEFKDYMPEDIMRIAKRYYNSGRIYEGLKKKRLKEVYPNKGESKKDFISRFMSVTKKEYPDIKQRYAVANAYWDRRDKVNEAYEEPPIDFGTGEAKGKDIFDRKTHTPFYDRILKYPEEAAEEENLKGEIVMMSPNEYYRECATKIFRDTTIDDIKEQRRWNKNNLAYLTKLVTKYKKKMFMPYINYAERGQEGLHRMMVAGDLFGWDEKFPVLVVTTYDEDRKEREDRAKEEYTIRKMFRDAVDRYRYVHDDEEELREKIMGYISDYYSPKVFEYYDPFTFIMWYHKNDEEYSGYDTCLVFVVANKGEDEVGEGNFSVEVDANGITFWDEEEDVDTDTDDDGLNFDEVDWDSPYWDDVDLNDPNLDIDALLKKVGKSAP